MSDITRTIMLDKIEALRLRKYTIIPEGGKAQCFEQRQVFLGTNPDNDVVLEDSSVSRNHARIEVDGSGYRIIDAGSKNGTFVNNIRVRDGYLEAGCSFRLGRQVLRFELGTDEVELTFSKSHQFGRLIGQSLAMREIFGLLSRVAPTPTTVLIEGESGTGKELIAEAIHQHSPRKDKPLVVFDCSAVSRELIESELFGHVKGSFTGAIGNRRGAFEQAEGGTLFLDELGELALDLQPKLLRAIEKREVRPVGGERAVPVDVRIVAATNRNLLREVEQGSFREDLYYRFAVIRVVLPPLRKRLDDIPLLSQFFLDQAAQRLGRSELQIPFSTMEKLKRYAWPGNVRELKNYVERAALLSQDDKLETRFLLADDAEVKVENEQSKALGGEAEEIAEMAIAEELPFKDAKQRLVEAFESSYWSRLLERTAGNVSKAARIAGVHRKSVEYIMKKLELSRDDIGV
ncbi:MAG: sigma 54-interacting transcriptional regulator [Myxococcota bacterium]|jgi:transcriptional regulator with GAF, ATPase, and Fis domain|nr:sigma 54-interacting transcriptional regulator [Myxococcota bacterium]